MRISDWSSDVCSSDLPDEAFPAYHFSETDALERISRTGLGMTAATSRTESPDSFSGGNSASSVFPGPKSAVIFTLADGNVWRIRFGSGSRSEEHTSELQSLMRISYAVFCLKKKNNITQ